MKNLKQILSARAGAVLAGLLLLSGGAFAQKAALVQSVDEPGRTPYQHRVGINPHQQPADNCDDFVCAISFPPVPVGKRLVITYVTADYSVATGASAVIIGDGSDQIRNGNASRVPVTQIRGTPGGAGRYIAGQTVMAFVDGGMTPKLGLAGQGVRGTTDSAFGTIVGYLVSVP